MRLSLRVQMHLLVLAVLGMGALLIFVGSSRRRTVESLRFAAPGDSALVERTADSIEVWLQDPARDTVTALPKRAVTRAWRSRFPDWRPWRELEAQLNRVARQDGHQLVFAESSGVFVAATAPEWRGAEPFGRPLAERRSSAQDSGRAYWASVFVTVKKSDGTSFVSLMIDRAAARAVRGPGGVVLGTLYDVRYQLDRELPWRHEDEPAARMTLVGGGPDPRVPLPRLPAWVRVSFPALLLAVPLMLVMLLLAVNFTVQPLKALEQAARRIASGDRAARVEEKGTQEVVQLARTFNQMADSLDRSESVRKRMVSDVAHELRTPITNLRCRIEAIRDGLSPASPDEVESLHEETLLLQRLVEDLQDLSLADAGGLRLEPEELDLVQVVASGLAAFEAEARGRGITFVREHPATLRVHGDPQRLLQVLRNLVANAVAHVPEGGVITVRLVDEGVRARLEVADNGPGIAPADRSRVFERFWRGDAARARGKGGAGLGLAIVKQWVEMHGGTVAVTSTPGAGARFIVELPGGPTG